MIFRSTHKSLQHSTASRLPRLRLPAARMVFLPLALLFTLASCEKVIDLDLKGVEAKYVIEGTLSNQAGDCRVLITQTKDFDQNNEFPGVSGAVVTIVSSDSDVSGDGETATILTETAPGVYEAPDLQGISGTTYTLKAVIGEETFIASSTMPEQIYMDTLFVTDETIFGETWKLANLVVPDPAGIENKYRCIQYINGEKTEQLFIRDDELVDGRDFDTKLYMDPGTDEEDRIQSGDSLKVEMHCIDAAMYQYWFSLEQGATGNGSPVTPANPVSNMEGGALGYFSAHTTETKAIRVP